MKSQVNFENPSDFMYKNIESKLFDEFENKVKQEYDLTELDFVLGTIAISQLLTIQIAVSVFQSPFGLTSGNLF